jgi:hypothetical protein
MLCKYWGLGIIIGYLNTDNKLFWALVQLSNTNVGLGIIIGYLNTYNKLFWALVQLSNTHVGLGIIIGYLHTDNYDYFGPRYRFQIQILGRVSSLAT